MLDDPRYTVSPRPAVAKGVAVKRFVTQVKRHEAVACAACPSFGHCPVRLVRGVYRVVHTTKQRCLAVRRRQEQTAAFQLSWEGFALEPAIGWLKADRDAHFWATHAGNEPSGR